MKVVVSGDRNYSNSRIIKTILRGLAIECEGNDEFLWVIAGEAPGADTIAKEWAKDVGRYDNLVQYEGHHAQWKKYGKGAGPVRNAEMLDRNPDIVLLFHDNIKNSKGTKNMRDQAVAAGVPAYLIERQ